MTKTIRLGHRMPYPITIRKIYKSAGDTVNKQESLLQYAFIRTEVVGDHFRDNTWEEDKTILVEWDSPVDGEITQWRIKEGEVINSDRECLVVEEACSHDIQFAGLCATCGKDMTEVNWASENRDTERAPINMIHDATQLKVSAGQAQRAEQESQLRLLRQRKLSLVVDLDQTIIHACIDPTIGEWQKDPNNPNYDAVKEVRSFQLEDGPKGVDCWYYIKLRPGLEEFLRKIADKYELHVYTMGTRAYAQSIAKLVDPQHKLFGNRVISRDENGSITAKDLQRLFPMNTNMVVIIDDRADVWPRNRPNLIKVVPYDFFKGIGDINSSFLPKREDLLATPAAAASPGLAKNGTEGSKDDATAANGDKSDKPSALQELVTLTGADNPDVTKRQIEQQARELEKQIQERPLLHLQEQLDKEDEEAQKTTPDAATGDTPPSSPPHQRHHVLLDDDRELYHLEEHLLKLHEEFYREYDRMVARNRSVVPDVGRVLDSLKARVLRGTKLVLSGLVPIGMDVRKSELGLQVASFGAVLRDRVSRDITHLVVSSARPRTQKVRQAAQFTNIKIVNQEWLLQCLTQWRRVDEEPYLVEIHPADRPKPKKANGSAETSDANNDDPDEEPDSEDEPVDDDEEDDEDLIPDGSMSPVDALKTFNWGEADEELDEFLASDDEDDNATDKDDGASTDKDTVNGDGENGDVSRKRKHADDDTESVASSTGNADETSGSVSKKQRLAGSSLRAEYNADADASLPTPQVTGDEVDTAVANGSPDEASAADNDDDDDDDDLEADILAEFEAEEQEEREEEQRKEDLAKLEEG
ncbi:RNA polymerase II subunit A C-terminal domain phosphatase [Coniochaeta sp. 2T2.1]|nr:RNA polymerase II subunit A C-terminal domain phosphatase [Coniochaeta sp. 2T2.1]